MDENNWYYNDNGRPTGPMTLSDLRQLFTAGRLHAGTLVWHATLVQWMAASQVPGLLPAAPPPTPPQSFLPYPPPSFHSAPRSNYHGMAVTAFVLSMVGLFPCFGFLLAIPGLILGIIALSGMSRTNNREGHGLAVAAVVIGAIACMCHCGIGFNMMGPPRYWHYQFRRQIPWNGWNT